MLAICMSLYKGSDGGEQFSKLAGSDTLRVSEGSQPLDQAAS